MRKEGEDGEGETQTPLKLKCWQGQGVMKETGGGRNGDPGSRDKKLKAERERSSDPETVVKDLERQNQDGNTDIRDTNTQEAGACPRRLAPGRRTPHDEGLHWHSEGGPREPATRPALSAADRAP